MILITILAFIILLLIAFVVTTIVVGGSAFIVIFADVIVCVAILGWIVYKLIHRNKG